MLAFLNFRVITLTATATALWSPISHKRTLLSNAVDERALVTHHVSHGIGGGQHDRRDLFVQVLRILAPQYFEHCLLSAETTSVPSQMNYTRQRKKTLSFCITSTISPLHVIMFPLLKISTSIRLALLLPTSTLSNYTECLLFQLTVIQIRYVTSLTHCNGLQWHTGIGWRSVDNCKMNRSLQQHATNGQAKYNIKYSPNHLSLFHLSSHTHERVTNQPWPLF